MGRMCTKCEIKKDWDEFYKSKGGKNGKQAQCKSCQKKECALDKRRVDEYGQACSSCGEYKLWDEYRLVPFTEKRKIRCVSCDEYVNSAINSTLKSRYGITYDDYLEMFEVQGGVCAICGEPETAKKKKSDEPRLLAVDHDHETGEVRGLLCTGCNQGLGNFKDSVYNLQAAAKYLLVR